MIGAFELNNRYLLSTGEHGVELLKQNVGSVGCTVNHWLKLSLCQDDLLTLEEFVQMFPVIELFLELKTVVELVHLYLFGVVA